MSFGEHSSLTTRLLPQYQVSLRRNEGAVCTIESEVRIKLHAGVDTDDTRIVQALGKDFDVRHLEVLARGIRVTFHNYSFCMFEVGQTNVIPTGLWKSVLSSNPEWRD